MYKKLIIASVSLLSIISVISIVSAQDSTMTKLNPWNYLGSHIQIASTTAGVKASYVTATSTTATSTFAGPVSVKDIISKDSWTDVRAFGAKGDGITDDTTAFLNALAYSKQIYIPKAGTYMLSATLYLNSSTTVMGVDGVILKKKSAYSHVFSNQAATTTGSIYDTNITLKNLIIDGADYDTKTGAAQPTMNGIVNWAFINGVIMDKITIFQEGQILFTVHIQSASNVRITNYIGFSDKLGGVQMQGGVTNVVIDGFDVSSRDDAFAINVADYPGNTQSTQDSSNITIKNGISRPYPGQAGFFLRLNTGSWLDWASGNTYQIGDVVVNASNHYKMQNAGPTVASNAPVHTSGNVTGADGIQWRWIDAGTNYTTNIYNVTVDNVNIDGRYISRQADDNTYNRSEYPGTEATSTVDGLKLSRLNWGTTPPTVLVSAVQKTGTIVLENITVMSSTSIPTALVYAVGTTETASTTIDTVLLSNVNTFLVSGKPIVIAKNGSVIKNLTFINPNITGKPDWSTGNRALAQIEDNSINNINIFGGNITYLPALYGSAGATTTTNLKINIYGTRFNSPQRIIYAEANETGSVNLYGISSDAARSGYNLFDAVTNNSMKVSNFGSTLSGASIYGTAINNSVTLDNKLGISTTTPYAALSVVGSTGVVADHYTATSTTATSTFAAGIQATYLNLTGASATSTATNGLNLSAGCFAINGVCVGGGGSGTVTSVATNNGLTGGTITTTGTLGLDITKLTTNALTTWNGTQLVATGTPALTAGYFISTSTTATNSFAGNINTNGSDLIDIIDSKSQSGALYFNGTTTASWVQHTLNQNIGTSDFTIHSRLQIPASSPTNSPDFLVLSSNATGNNAAYGLEVALLSANRLGITFYDSTTGNYNFQAYGNFITNWANKTVDLDIIRSGLMLYVYANGILQATTTQSIAGTGSIGSSITSTYAYIGGKSGSNIFKGNIYETKIFNRALSLTDVQKLRENGSSSTDEWGNLTGQTSGTITVDKNYRITTFVAGDDFTNVGASSNATGVEFTSTWATPTTWANGSTLNEIGVILDSDLENANPAKSLVVKDRSSNNFSGVVTTAGVTQIKPQVQIGSLFLGSTGNVGVGTSTPYSRFHVTSGANATTTTTFGEIGNSTSKSCFNAKTNLGAAVSFYFVGTTMVVESTYCK